VLPSCSFWLSSFYKLQGFHHLDFQQIWLCLHPLTSFHSSSEFLSFRPFRFVRLRDFHFLPSLRFSPSQRFPTQSFSLNVFCFTVLKTFSVFRFSQPLDVSHFVSAGLIACHFHSQGLFSASLLPFKVPPTVPSVHCPLVVTFLTVGSPSELYSLNLVSFSFCFATNRAIDSWSCLSRVLCLFWVFRLSPSHPS